MSDDNLADRVGVDEADVKHERDEVVMQDNGLKIEVKGYEGPGYEIRY